ncbi:MAG: formylglycine-generating enzyme family protein, partial [Planctomycetota bacterium]|nr:formylglycine-generating enzyme family protein [Planctomycetota bacterium]
AGESAADVQKAGLSDASLDAIKEALRTELSRSDGTTAKERVHAGHILGRLGDPREEVTTLEEMQFCLVPGGPFMMGGSDENALEDEKPAGEYDELSYSYWMGRFPVTNAQFGKFVEAKGYEIEEIWKEARDAQRWEGGRFVDDPDYFENDPRTGPVSYGEPYDLPNHPVVGVTWYECLAFSRWLTQEWQREHGLAEDWAFRLPTEPEWEKAARGGINIPTENQRRKLSQVALLMRPGGLSDAEAQANPNPGRTYPWGHAAELDTASSEHLNFNETQIGSTNAVGSFPLGVSVFGSEEMSGGVLEWCLNRSADYPYEPGDGREEIDEKMDSRVLRGGSFASDSRFVRCAYRGRDVPDFRINCIGFRLCLSPISSSLISEPSDL